MVLKMHSISSSVSTYSKGDFILISDLSIFALLSKNILNQNATEYQRSSYTEKPKPKPLLTSVKPWKFTPRIRSQVVVRIFWGFCICFFEGLNVFFLLYFKWIFAIISVEAEKCIYSRVRGKKSTFTNTASEPFRRCTLFQNKSANNINLQTYFKWV